MLMAGVPVKEQYCISYNHQDEIAEALASLKQLPDIFICANDFVAGDTIRALFSIGKQVPDDVRILGFDDSGTALMLAVFALQDSFGTACNVTGDGALTLFLTGYAEKKHITQA
jgi:Na+/H+-dicarboxylate symporter